MTAIVGEIVTPDQLAEINTVSAILPPDVETKVVALRNLDSPEMQARAVTVMLSHARTGLLAAIAAHDLPSIVEFKAKASAIAEISKQMRLGKEMQLDAAEFVRRAERGLGVAIRDGQANGTVETADDAARRGGKIGRGTWSSEDQVKTRVSDVLTKTEITGGKSASESVFAMTDGVSDEQFEEAITEARDEGKVSRANVARKAKAKAAAPTPEPEPVALPDDTDGIDDTPTPAPPVVEWPFRNSPTEMLTEIIAGLSNAAENITWIQAGAVAPDDLAHLTKQARDAWSCINKHLKGITA